MTTENVKDGMISFNNHSYNLCQLSKEFRVKLLTLNLDLVGFLRSYQRILRKGSFEKIQSVPESFAEEIEVLALYLESVRLALDLPSSEQQNEEEKILSDPKASYYDRCISIYRMERRKIFLSQTFIVSKL